MKSMRVARGVVRPRGSVGAGGAAGLLPAAASAFRLETWAFAGTTTHESKQTSASQTAVRFRAVVFTLLGYSVGSSRFQRCVGLELPEKASNPGLGWIK